MKAQVRPATVVLDFDPSINTLGGLLGQWLIEARDADGKLLWGLMSSQQGCLQKASLNSIRPRDIEWTDRARKAAWAAFRRAYK